MKRLMFLATFLTMAFAGLTLAMPQPVAAKFNPDNQIHVYGKILPTHHLIVNGDGKIIEIISNTAEQKPDQIFVYIDKISPENKSNLNELISAEYNKLMINKTSHAGTIYKYDPVQKLSSDVLEEMTILSEGSARISTLNSMLG
jgi:hypothetical protein